MKRAIPIIIIILVVAGGGIVWLKSHGDGAAPAADKPAADEDNPTHVTHDEQGNTIVNISDDTQGDIGLLVAQPEAAQWSPELKGYGRALDPAPLAALLTELASAQAAYPASSNELARLKTLSAQGNAAVRAVQAAEAAAAHDLLAIQSARDRLALEWGRAVADRGDLPAFVMALTSLDSVLVRVDLPAGESLAAPPAGARLVPLDGAQVEAEYFGPVSGMDPQTQGHGFLLLVKQNAGRLLPGEAVTGYLKLPGEPLSGVNIPRSAVVRTEGGGWVYVLDAGGEAYKRTPIELDRPTETGWFEAKGVTPANHIVVTGAQTLLSEELKASLKAD